MKKAFILLPILCAALLLAACGGKSGSNSPAQVTPRQVTPAPSTGPASSPALPVPATPAPGLTTSSDLPGETGTPAPDDEPEAPPARLFAAFLDEEAPPAYYDAFVADDGEYSVQVVYSVDTTVTDVRVLSLAMTDYKDGKPVYDETELYRQESLAPDCPLVVTLVFAGDLPNNGLSFVNPAGETQRFSLSQSGKDGSLFLEEY